MSSYTPTVWTNGSGSPINATNLTKIECQLATLTDGGFYLDAYGGTDDDRLTAALADQAAAVGTNRPPIILPSRPLSFNIPRPLHSGLKIIGVYKSGQKNLELEAGANVGPMITLGGDISSGPSSWWNGAGVVFNVYMADFSVQGSQGSPTHQFLDQPVGTLFACHFDSLSFNFMRGVFGREDRKCLMTQVACTGSWTMNNAWSTQMHCGGSDCVLFMDSFNNVGTSASSAQTGALGSYFFKFDSLEATIGKTYMTVLNGWRGVLISGKGTSIDMHGGVYEGYKSWRQDGLLSGPAPGSLIRITGGSVSMHGTKVGQGMDNPHLSENGLLRVGGGEVHLSGVTFYGQNMGFVNAIEHTGGRLSALGVMRRQNEGDAWNGRPRCATLATVDPGPYSFCCPDQSLQPA